VENVEEKEIKAKDKGKKKFKVRRAKMKPKVVSEE
jgi:hypothetical protein